VNTYTYDLAAVLLPPISPLLIALGGLLLARRRRRLGFAVATAALALDLALSMPAIAYALADTLEPPPLHLAGKSAASAIVVLGGGRNRGAPEWDGETVDAATLERLRYAARLARTTGLPMLVSGGKPNGGNLTEAKLMHDVLTSEYGVAPRWVEDASLTTAENARLAAPILRRNGHHTILLVTSAMHMPRARGAFERQGFAVIAAPTGYRGQRPFELRQLVPDLGGTLELSHDALREHVADLWYRWRARMVPAERARTTA
jgi:uncharacterized SAM-binding protein YcdF (DUF218 family)